MRHEILRSAAAFFLLPAAGLILTGCPEETQSAIQLKVEASPRTVVADGQNTVQIIVTGMLGEEPATGVVTLTTTRGTFAGTGSTFQDNLAGGTVEATLVTCDSVSLDNCAGTAMVRADMGTRNASVSVNFEAIVIEPACDPDQVPVDSCEDVDACFGLACGLHGRTCDVDGACSCPGGATDESLAPVATGIFACNDGIDHDCDGLTDCRDPDCEEQPCAAHGKVCDAGLCVCPHGFADHGEVQDYLDTPEGQQETGQTYACAQTGLDWDCDGLIGCQDTDCEGLLCADNSMVCEGGACVCPGNWTNESLAQVLVGTYACGDGKDHDCDGKIDCADPDCHTLPCSDGHICDIATEECIPDPGLEQVTFWLDGPERVLAGSATSVPLWVELRSGDSPLNGQSVTFQVDGGYLLANDMASYTTTTNALGRATVTWAPGTTPARDLNTTVTVNETGSSKSLKIQVIGLSTISVQSTAHTTMGVAQSGYQETNIITFSLRGTDGIDANLPIPDGVPVTFDTGGNVTGGLRLTNATATSLTGLVQTTAVSGTAATTFSVRAVATQAGVTRDVTTQSIAVVGAKPSQQGMTLVCNKRNIGAYVNTDGTNYTEDITVQCTVTLQDRFGNPIGVATQVNFMAEGGSIVSPVPTSTAAATLGQATTTFRTIGPLPRRVDPVENEPNVIVGSGEDATTRNPRDGLITIMAYTTGEEQFIDLNGNGMWDAAEPFIDMGEPFLDSNDSGVWESGKPFVDHTGNGGYDGPNGTWDSNTLIWTETRILATGHPVSYGTTGAFYGSGFYENTGLYVPWSGLDYTQLYLADENMNPPPPARITSLAVVNPTTSPPVTVSYAGGGGTSFTYPDAGWGSGIDSHIRWRRLIVCSDAPTTICDGCNCGVCGGNRCTIRGRVGPFTLGSWGGYWHSVQVTRNTQVDGGPFQIRAAYNGTSPHTTFFASGEAEPKPAE